MMKDKVLSMSGTLPDIEESLTSVDCSLLP